MADILHLVTVKAPADRVFDALSEQRCLLGWWTEDVHAEPRIGTVAKFRFGANGGCDMEILALQSDRLVRWRCIANLSGDEWVGTEVSFELRAKNAGTNVVFSHRRWSEATDFLRTCSVRWALYLISLKNLVETGAGNPWPRDIQS
jgi:uncharacterized protein YndB with AHSA1/START domain